MRGWERGHPCPLKQKLCSFLIPSSRNRDDWEKEAARFYPSGQGCPRSRLRDASNTQLVNFAVAVAQLIEWHADLIQQRQEQIRHRRFGIDDVAAWHNAAIAAPQDDQGQVYVRLARMFYVRVVFW